MGKLPNSVLLKDTKANTPKDLRKTLIFEIKSSSILAT